MVEAHTVAYHKNNVGAVSCGNVVFGYNVGRNSVKAYLILVALKIEGDERTNGCADVKAFTLHNYLALVLHKEIFAVVEVNCDVRLGTVGLAYEELVLTGILGVIVNVKGDTHIDLDVVNEVESRILSKKISALWVNYAKLCKVNATEGNVADGEVLLDLILESGGNCKVSVLCVSIVLEELCNCVYESFIATCNDNDSLSFCIVANKAFTNSYLRSVLSAYRAVSVTDKDLLCTVRVRSSGIVGDIKVSACLALYSENVFSKAVIRLNGKSVVENYSVVSNAVLSERNVPVGHLRLRGSVGLVVFGCVRV